MRNFINIIETAGKITAWHSSSNAIEKILPFMHLGTKKAAKARGGKMLYEFLLDVRNPLEINDSIGATHPVEGLAEYLETELELSTNDIDVVLMKCRAEQAKGIPSSLAGGAALAKLLIKKGYDFLSYTNAVEDVGSTSWIVVDPRRVVMIGKESNHS